MICSRVSRVIHACRSGAASMRASTSSITEAGVIRPARYASSKRSIVNGVVGIALPSHDHQHIAGDHRPARLAPNLDDLPMLICEDRDLHLHGFDHQQLVAFTDLLTGASGDRPD